MKNLLAIEKEYKQLQKKLSLAYSSRYRAAQIFGFLKSLTNLQGSETYLLELIAPLNDALENLSYRQIAPKLLSEYNSVVEELLKNSTNDYVKRNLSSISDLLMAEKEKQEELFSQKFNKQLKTAFIKKRKGFKRIFEGTQKSRSEVTIPFVEKEPFIADEKPNFGTLRKLKVKVEWLSKDALNDEVDIGINTEKEKVNEYEAIIRVAKNLFASVTGLKIDREISVHCILEDQNIISGNSLEAGLTACIFTSLFKLHDLRITFDLPETLAITGRINEEGKLLPVDEEGLKLKIEACAFSAITNLIVPIEQENFCKEHLSKIETDNGGVKLLEITGIENIREVYYDRRNLEESVTTFIEHAVRQTWKRRRPIAAILFLSMALLIGKTYLGPIDRHPARIIYEGEDLVIKNWFYQELKRIEIGSSQVEQALGLYDPSDLIADTCDIDADGYTDVIYFDQLMKNSNYEKVICYSVIKDSVLWSYNMRKKINIPNNPIPGEQIHGRFLLAGDYDQDKKSEVYIVASSNYSPGMILKLDAQTGKELASYVHYGHLSKIRFSDLDHDGNEELITCGTNQVFRTACLIVLNPKFMNGHGPVDELNKIEGYDEAKEKYYIKIPFTMVAKAYGAAASYSMANNITVKDENEDIRLEIRDADYNGGYGNPEFYIHFDFNLRAVEFAKSDNYNTHVINLLKEKKISRFPDAAYFQEYKKEIVYLMKPSTK